MDFETVGFLPEKRESFSQGAWPGKKCGFKIEWKAREMTYILHVSLQSCSVFSLQFAKSLNASHPIGFTPLDPRFRLRPESSIERNLLQKCPKSLIDIHTKDSIDDSRLARGNSQHYATPLTASPRNYIWGTTADIPYWWRLITQILVVLQIFNQSKVLHKPYFGSCLYVGLAQSINTA